MKRLIITSLCVLFVSTTAFGDWFPGEDYKMLWPQLPDPFGWDVKAGFDPLTGLQKVLADDWLCTESGPIEDVHLWGSWKNDDPGLIESIRLSIYSDVPAATPDDYSHPGDLLWEGNFFGPEIVMLNYGTGLQGWFNPNTGEVFENDHFMFHQINITDIAYPFIPKEGTIYWLGVTVNLLDDVGTGVEWGWKTTQDNWNDDAVYGDYNAAGGVVDFWYELRDPFTGESLDMAFVIASVPGPEPDTLFVQAPNGGEVLTGGEAYLISWSNTGTISNVLIEYSDDNGGAWNNVDTVPNTGSYNWLVPQVNSSQCLVRISDASGLGVSDTSDNVFTIIANNPPVADAGPNQTVTDYDGDGFEQVTLDGSASDDTDGTIVSWVWTDDLGDPIPDGENPIATLRVGTHNITLIVTDNDGAASLPDAVVITVNPRQPTTLYVDDDAPDDPAHGDPSSSDPLEDGSAAHPYDAIQEGINVAFDGDTVVVLDGTYTGMGNRDIDFLGKAITVRSTDPNDPDVVAATIVDCQGTEAEPHRGFYFHSGEDSNSVLAGLTITNGYVTGREPVGNGGGIYCENSSPTITNCTFTGNSAWWDGGGMANRYSSPTVTGCTFTGNYGRGGGMYNGDSSSPTVTGCTFTGNRGADGSGMYNYNSSPTVTNCTFTGNSANDFGGGGMFNHSSSPTVTGCTFTGNTAVYYGGGMYNYDSSPTVTNCMFTSNSAVYRGGGGIINDHSSPTVTNCTFSGNSANDFGGGIGNEWSSSQTVTNCILWGNLPQQIVNGTGCTSAVTYSDIAGGYAGTGNIDVDPCFVDAENDDFHLLPNSPCIDAGDNAAVPPEITTDLDGNPRFFDDIFTIDTGNGTPPIVDMGAYEYTYGGENLPDLEITSEDIVFGAYPAVPGEVNSISATVWNRGNIPAINIEVSFADSSGFIDSNTISMLDPNQSATVSIWHSWPDTGYQLITVTVDPADNIDELDETNNTGSKVYQIGDPEDANAILDVSWNSAPGCYTEGTSAIIRGKAEYRIEITGGDDIVSAALGSIVTAQLIDSNGVVTNLQSTLTGPGGYFYIPFIVPGADYGSFTIEISVTDGTLTGAWEKIFCINPPDPPTPPKDLWICGEITSDNDTPNIGDTVTLCATVCAAPDNNDTLFNIPVTFYAYPPTGGAYQIDSNTIDQMAPDSNETVCVDWTPTVNGLHRIRVIIGPGYSDDNNGNNYKYYNIVVGMFNVSASPRWAVVGQQVQITVDSREPLPSDQLDSITVLDSASQPIPFSPADPCHPTPTRWVYQTDPLPAGTAFGTATITVTGTDSGSVQHTGEGYFKVYEIPPDFWLHSCDVNFSNLNPALGEPITIDAVVHADSSNPETESDIPVSFYSKHLPSGGDYIEIYQTQYTGEIIPDEVSASVSVPWQNAAKGEYIIKVQLGPGFSDRNNGNNAATRAILVGDNIPFDVEFIVLLDKTRRIGRTVFEYECNVRMNNQTDLTLENVQLELTGVSSNMTLVSPYTATFAEDIGPKGSVLSGNTCTFTVDRSVEIDSTQIEWYLIYQLVDICGIQQQTSSSTIILGSDGDITGDNEVDIDDLVQLANDWLKMESGLLSDIYPPPDGDGIVDFLDFAFVAENWLAGVTP